MMGLSLLVCLRLLIGLLSACNALLTGRVVVVVVVGGCSVMVYTYACGLSLYRYRHGFGFCSGGYVQVEEEAAAVVCAG